MDMSSGSGRVSAEINVTPLIDVLLVLLIIFMVIAPIASRGLNSLIPQPSKRDQPVVDGTVVVQILANGAGNEASYLINSSPLPKSQVVSKLAAIFAGRHNRVMFVKGDPSLDFERIAEVIDFAHQANVDQVGLMTPGVAVKP